jgi:DNA topoisomerase-1
VSVEAPVGLLAAKAAGLQYVDDSIVGYRRRRAGRGFVYLDESGRPIRDPEVVDRLRRLVVPPAWTDVWFCSDPLGHIQATGRDARLRKQYRYHDEWQRVRDEAKFDSLLDFGHALPGLRERVEADMSGRALSFERVVATTVWLLDRTLIRIGNDEYARAGDSYGLTTLRNGHAEVGSATLRFRFTGKSGKPHDVVLHDRRVARTIARCQELPGQRLLEYVDDDGIRPVDSRDVNDYIREVTKTDFTAKTFRTWGGSVHALHILRAFDPPESATAATRQQREAIKDTAAQLRNTPTVCRRSYIHPLVLEAHREGLLADMFEALDDADLDPWLSEDEHAMLELLATKV